MSASGNSFTLNSVDYGGGTYNVYVVEHTFVASGKPRVETVELADADGVASWGNTFDAKRLRLGCVLGTGSVANLNTWIDNVVAAWEAAHAAGPTSFVLDLLSPRTWANTRPLSGIDVELALTGMMFKLELLCTDGAET